MIREFYLSPHGKGGVSCDEAGAFVGVIPILVRMRRSGKDEWRPRDCDDLSEAMSAQYGLPVDMSSKESGLQVVAKALNDGDVARAQIATVLLGIPDPPQLSKRVPSRQQTIKIIRDLRWSGLLKADWDPDEHPRWPAGAPDSQGGQFAPKRSDANAQASSSDHLPDANAPSAIESPRYGAQQGALDDAVYHPDSDSIELDPTASTSEQLRQNWQQHEDEVNRQVRWLESKGYGAIKVTKNVSFIGRNGVRVTVDYVVSRWLPDGMDGVWLVPWYGADVKTGKGGLTGHQTQVYPKIGAGTWVTPVGLNVVDAGFEVGEEVYFPIVYGDALSRTEH